VISLLEESLSQMERILLRSRLRVLADEFLSFLSGSGRSFNPSDSESQAPLLVEFLVDRMRRSQKRITELNGLQSDFNQKYSRAVSERERREQILQLARRLGSTRSQLRKDREAFQRWFGYDTIVERVSRRISECEYELTFLLNILGGIGPFALFEAGDALSQDRFWNLFNLGDLLKALLVFRGDPRVRIQAFKCLAGCVAALLPDVKNQAVDAGTLALIYRSSLDTSQQAWTQCEALRLLAVIDSDSFTKALKQRLTNPGAGEDLFFRRRAVQMLGEYLPVHCELVDLIPIVCTDPSPYVRQGLTMAVGLLLARPGEVWSEAQALSWARSLALSDPSPQVRAAMLTELTTACVVERLEPTVTLFTQHFAQEEDSFVLRSGLRTVAALTEKFAEGGLLKEAAQLMNGVLPSIETLHQTASDLSVRRWAAMARERVLIATNIEAAGLKQKLQDILKGTKFGGSRRLPRSIIQGVNEELLGRVLSVMSQEDFGLSLRYGISGPRITRGEVFGFRFWRLLHEFFSPAPDKRQGFRHTIGRKTEGDLRTPSAIVSELSQTKVPGEPLFMASECGWRPYLPLADDVLTSAKRWFSRKAIKFFTAEGVTELKPPRSLFRRVIAGFALTLRFPKYAGLRNWSEDANMKPDSYVRALEDLGFTVQCRGYASDQGQDTSDPAVRRFFGAASPAIGLDTWHRLSEYFLSAYENSLYQLGLFAAGLLLLFAGQRTYLGWAVRKARKSFDLVVGGWGTRGKSGTERLKTALVEALGHGLVAKTTGCEAMFLHAYPFGKTREMFIYRSYDKATIWEHHNIMVLGQELGCKVFLWECMGLNASFVKILQRQWSIDDYSTITNTYPDHEDIQGPAGINIPEVMTNFIPKGRVLITSEQEMKPVLSTAAQELGTRLVSVGWLEAGLLTPDVLSRFPYEEHPTNIALALALAGELGIEPDFALKEMADRVVPDLGVLKVFPWARIRHRSLEFVNGMSANERFAALSNWARMGFDAIHPETHPDVMISTVINNRADRLSRSRVFASILVEDIAADRNFIIGSNVLGLMGFVEEAWETHVLQVSLLPRDDEDKRSPEQRAAAVAHRLRIPTSLEQIQKRLQAMLDGLNAQMGAEHLLKILNNPNEMQKELEKLVDSDLAAEIAAHIHEQLVRYGEYEALTSRIRAATASTLKTIDPEFRELAGRWFMGRFVVIEDYHASGDQVIDRICRETPPGILNRVMGIQNIKGTGLDFVYRWLAWEQCHQICARITSDDRVDVVEKSVNELSAFQEFGILCEDEVNETLAIANSRPVFQAERFQAEFAVIESNMNQRLSTIKATLGSSQSATWWRILIDGVEAFLDAGDAIRRRKTANRIYKDLVQERISHDRAAMELKGLNKRQTGGWLAAWLGIRSL
jgi:gamma-polyglutamate synthase